MKAIRLIAAIAAAALLAASCGVLGTSTTSNGTAATTQPTSAAYNNGQSSGTALLNLYSQYKADGNKLQLSNASNLLNIAALAANIEGLKQTDSTTTKKAYIKDFAKGLILGSTNLVNQQNSTSVVEQLTTLAGIDLSALTGKATAATETASTAVNTAAQSTTSAINSAAAALNSANEAATALKGIFGLFKNTATTEAAQ